MSGLPDSYDSWKMQGPPEGQECPECCGLIDEDGSCEDCDFEYTYPDYDDRDD